MAEDGGAKNGADHIMYTNKAVLAPMVRVCSLPMRLLALEYGADLVYCEEIIDRKILMCQREENELLGTTDFTLSDGTVVFRTCPQEKDKLIYQIGTSDASRALAAAKRIEDCVAGVDVNMGCPKEFSIKGGMGAALLSNTEKVKKILTTLVNGLSIPVTCKIRVFPELEKTIQLVKLIEKTGVSAIAVHGRTKQERPTNTNRNDYIRAIAQAVSIPVIANGGSKGIASWEDVCRFKEETGASSVMIARAAEWNCSVFRKEGPLPVTAVIKRYLHYALTYGNMALNSKYCVLQMLHDKMNDMPEGDRCLAAKSHQEFVTIWEMQDEYDAIVESQRKRRAELAALHRRNNNHGIKRRKLDNGNVYIELPVRYDKRMYSSTLTPKQVLNNWVIQERIGKLKYETTQRPEDRLFNSCVTLEGKTFSHPSWEKSKQTAEQAAAIACLIVNDKDDGRRKEFAEETQELHRKCKCLLTNDNSTTEGGDLSIDDSKKDEDSSSSIYQENQNGKKSPS